MKALRNYIRTYLIKMRSLYLARVWGHKIHSTAIVSFSAYLDRTNPRLIEIGAYSIITRGAVVLSHDYSRATSAKTSIGKNCMIGVNAIVLPGVSIGDEVIVGAGSVVTKDIVSNSLAVGNPAKVIKKIRTRQYGQLLPDNSSAGLLQ